MPGLTALWARRTEIRSAVRPVRRSAAARRFLVILLLALPAFAQKDFLTDTEVDKVREAQEPAERLKLYLSFAKQRLDQLQSITAKDRPGRSGEIRQLLEDYSSIIDAIDTVSTDALARKADLTTGPALITDGEKKFLAQLQKLQDSAPRDIDMYEFTLKEAIETTTDSIDLANEDLSARTKEVTAKEEKEKKDVADVNAAEKGLTAANPTAAQSAAAQEVTKPTRKPPTLYRPGEKPDDGKQ
jgi:uncharacterized protein involved in exopolysaccharide biosynthesis